MTDFTVFAKAVEQQFNKMTKNSKTYQSNFLAQPQQIILMMMELWNPLRNMSSKSLYIFRTMDIPATSLNAQPKISEDSSHDQCN